MTNAALASLVHLARDLTGIDARWALIGGFAVSARAEPRFTRDVDVCVLVDSDENAERAVLALNERGYSVASIVEHEEMNRLATVRLVPPVTGGVLVDLLFASSGLEPEIVEAAEPLEILPGLVVPVARAAHLVVLKLLSRDDDNRPQDGIDLHALRPTLTAGDGSEARRVARVVADRGFNRDRDLVALVDAYLAGA